MRTVTDSAGQPRVIVAHTPMADVAAAAVGNAALAMV